MRIWSVGAGAIGGTIAARLTLAGADVHVVDADPEHVERLLHPGLRVGDEVTPLQAMLPADVPDEEIDLLLLAVRTGATRDALAPFVGQLAADADVVSLQNGLNEETIASVVGAERTVGCVVGFGATYVGAGHVELDAEGGLVVGRLPGSPDAGLERAQGMLDRAFPTRISGNITGDLWGKIVVNAMTVLGALGAMRLGELLADAGHRELVADVVAEAVDVATADGVRLPKVLGVADPQLVASRGDGWRDALEEAFALAREHFGDVRSVTWRDLERGRPIEVDAVTGEIVGRGDRLGVPVPLNRRALELLRDLEAGRRPLGPENLDVLVAVRT